jgi:diguanylate cyclase (GGDEF)-like protein
MINSSGISVETKPFHLKQMLSTSIASLVSGVLLALLLAYVQRGVIATNFVLTWLFLILLTTLFRATLTIAYLRHPTTDYLTSHARMVRFRLGVLVAGAIWGLAGILLFPAGDPSHQMFLILTLAGLTAGGVISYSADLVCAIGFTVLALVPIVIRMFVEADTTSVAMGMAMILYLVFMGIVMRHINQSLSENIRLRLEAASREYSLRISEEALREAQEIASLGSYTLDIPTGNWESSEVLDKLFGIDKTFKHSVEGWANLVYPDDRKMMESYLENKVLGSGESFDKEYRIIRQNDQAVRWMHGLGRLVFNADGSPLEMRGTIRDITLAKLAEEEMRRLALFDPLTSLPNRRLLMDRLHQALASSARVGRNGAVLFIDLDNFKTLNDTLGHKIGDLHLQEVAQRLESCVRDGDTVARMGGDEFVVVLENLSESAIEAVAQTNNIGLKILATLDKPYHLEEYEHHSTASIGVTIYSGYKVSIEELIKQADSSMYQAKKAGRNTLRFFDPEIINNLPSIEGHTREILDS